MPVASPEKDDEVIVLFRWRRHQFVELGFTLAQSRSLAEQGADWHEAERLVDAGCPVHVAFNLLS